MRQTNNGENIFKINIEEAVFIAKRAGVSPATVRRWMQGSDQVWLADDEFKEWPRRVQLRFIAMIIDGEFAGDRFPVLDARRRIRGLLNSLGELKELGLID